MCLMFPKRPANTKLCRDSADLRRQAIELGARACRAIARARTLHQRARELMVESRRLRQAPRVLLTPRMPSFWGRRLYAMTGNAQVAWHLVALLLVLTSDGVSEARHQPVHRHPAGGVRGVRDRGESAPKVAWGGRARRASRDARGPSPGPFPLLTRACSSAPSARCQTDRTARTTAAGRCSGRREADFRSPTARSAIRGAGPIQSRP